MAVNGRFYINWAGGTLKAINAIDGKELWTTVLGPTCSDDIPLRLNMSLKGGVLFVPGDTIYLVNPDTGAVIHALADDPPVPDLFLVNSDYKMMVAEESGHIAMYDISRRFVLVKGGI
jgi:hypothetical protein